MGATTVVSKVEDKAIVVLYCTIKSTQESVLKCPQIQVPKYFAPSLAAGIV